MNSRTPSRISLAEPDLRGNEKAYALDAIESTWISSAGPYLKRFEREFAEVCNTKFAFGVANGTVALHLALLALDVGPGDEVIVPSLTYIATANAVRYVGAEPVFVDVEPESWGLSAKAVEAAITNRTKAVIAVHLYGHPADMDAIRDVTSSYGIAIVEDAAEAHLARYKGRPAGTLGDIATFSFYGNKILTSGEGGAITFNDERLAPRLQMLRGQGMDPNRRYYFPIIGYNYRMTNIAAALLCAQLERAEEIVSFRKAILDAYEERLANIPGLGFRPRANWADPAPWLFCLTVDAEIFGRDRDALMAILDREGIETRPFFIPIHTLPPYEQSKCVGDLHWTNLLGSSGLNLPTHRSVTTGDIDRICSVIREAHQSA